jgi:hypothetical protein
MTIRRKGYSENATCFVRGARPITEALKKSLR